MNKLMKIMLASLLLVLTCTAQISPTPNLAWSAMPVPTPVTLAGVAGSTTYCYWVVAIYTGGKSQPAGPQCTFSANATLSSTNYDIVSFLVPTGYQVVPTGYDILRTTSQTPPTGACACVVASNQSASPVNDQSSTLSAYTIATGQASLAFTLTTMPSAVAVNASTDANNTIYLSPIFVPVTFTSLGGCWYNGTTVTSDKHMIEVFNSSGTLLANSATAGVADSGNANKFQCTTWTATVTLVGPAMYWVGAVSNGTTDTLNTYAAGSVPTGFFAGDATQTFGTPANITPPTSFTAAQGPLMQIY